MEHQLPALPGGSRRSLGPLLDAIEGLHGNPVTPQNEADWERKFSLQPSISDFKDELAIDLGIYTTGPALHAATRWRVGKR